MNWDALGASAEAVGALAILITLIYLAVQVRQAKLAAADTNRLTRASGVREVMLTMMQNPKLRESVWSAYGTGGAQYLQALAEQTGGSVEDAAQIDLYTQYYLWLHWGQFSTTMTPADERELRNIAAALYNVPAIRYAWENGPGTKAVMDADFAAFIDSVLEEPI